MQTIRIAAVSMNSFLGETERNLTRIGEFCGRAADEKAELVLFPELVVHGHCTPNTWELAEAVPDGPSVRRLAEMAARFRLFLSVGMSEKDRDIVYNTQVLVGPTGYIGKQRKLHLSRDEVQFYKGGKEIRVFDLGKCRVGTVICYDNQFPEIARIMALRGAEVILMPHAARQGRWDDTSESEAQARQHVFRYFQPYAMRARENACFCVMADQAGRGGYVDTYPRDHHNQPHHPGGAFVWSPAGELLLATQTERIKDEMIVCDLDHRLLARARAHPNYTLRTRRPELFGELVKDQVAE
ncbi:MAG: apolipoprotein N-acyltransferase [Gemmatales bacterium]|nr:MAG: apolipoprotein N-acyltransferase [Gemmatales bacterium]